MSISPRLTRAIFGGALIVAPLLLLAALLADPAGSADDARGVLDAVAGNPGAWAMTGLLFALAGAAFVPAGLGLMRLMAGRAPRLAFIGGTAVVVGALGLVALDASSFYLDELAVSDVPLAEQVAIVEAHESSAGVATVLIVHIVGMFGGLLLVAIGLLRARVVAAWAPVALIIGVLGFVAAPGKAGITVAGALLLAGLAACGLGVLRMSEQAWEHGEPAPDRRTGTSPLAASGLG
jgi:hypothetical protein